MHRQSPLPSSVSVSSAEGGKTEHEEETTTDLASKLADALQQLERNQAEFRAYRRRAMAMLKDKDAELKQLKKVRPVWLPCIPASLHPCIALRWEAAIRFCRTLNRPGR